MKISAEFGVIAEPTNKEPVAAPFVSLSEIELAIVGGGCGEVVFG